MEREIDLIEEIARLHGYDEFANTLPAYSGEVVEQPHAVKDMKFRTSLLALGYHETISLTFISKEDARRFSPAAAVELANPISDEASVMRTSMLPGMLNMLAYNLNRGTEDVRLFEAGNVFEAVGDKTVELKRLCIGATGSAVQGSVHQPARPLSFFDVKGDVEDLLAPFASWTLYCDAEAADYYHPGRSARVVMDGATVAQFGQLHPDMAAARKIRQDVFAGEIFLDRLYQHDLRQVRYEALPRFPAVSATFRSSSMTPWCSRRLARAFWDWAFPNCAALFRWKFSGATRLARESIPFCCGPSFSLGERTLREDEVAQWSGQISKALEGLGGVQRA